MSGLDKLRSIFEDELQEKVELFKENQPIDKFDTKLNYNDRSFSSQTYTFSTDLTQRGGRDNPILDSLLRGRVYEPIRFSQDFVNNNLFVKPETGEITNQLFKEQTFDPRSTTPKLDTLYFNTNKSFNPATNPTDFSTAVGNNDSPFTPITSLGGQFKENLSWENLYNANHTPKTEVKYKDKIGLNYGVNVNRDNLNIKYNVGGDGVNSATRYGEKSGIIGGFSRTSLFGRGEPYIVSDINDDSKTKGGRTVPIVRALNDGDRILQFLTSPEGISFVVQQNTNSIIPNTVSVDSNNELTRTPQRFGTSYNPLSSLAASAARLLGQSVPNILIKKSGFEIAGNFLENISEKQKNSLANKFNHPGGLPKDNTSGQSAQKVADLLKSTEYGESATNDGFSINDTFTEGLPQTDSTTSPALTKLQALGKKVTEAFGLDKPTPTSFGDKMTLSPMIKGNSLTDETGGSLLETDDEGVLKTDYTQGTNAQNKLTYNIEDPKYGMPFYFKDMRDKTYIFFRAFIEGLTENISPSYASTNYIGRSEPVYTYERAEREISMTLKLVAQTKGELEMIYKKMNRLTSLCYPQYTSDLSTEDPYGNRMKPPLTKLRYGELYGESNNELMGYIKSVSYSVEQSSPYETDIKKRVPRHITATIGYQVIHDKAPRLGTKFYGYIGE